ncbi:hypothetical protein ACFYVD_10500 [Rhodococcus pyridinivorans]|uniref:hypothetical protein n=1 Tax=Rhodococcus pyridinivorans TaxID=103816 RepID=UPI0036B6AA1F
MRRRVKQRGAAPDELTDYALWCTRRGYEGWEDPALDGWRVAVESWADEHGWTDGQIGMLVLSRKIPDAPWDPALI